MLCLQHMISRSSKCVEQKVLISKQVLTVLEYIKGIGGEVGIVVGHEQVAFIIQNLGDSAWIALGRTVDSSIKECQLFIGIRP